MSTIGVNPYASFKALQPEKAAQAPEAKGAEKSVIAEGVADFRAAIQQAEQASINTATTGADPHAMVEALANAELVLDTAVTIRDKVVEAYQELLRMPV